MMFWCILLIRSLEGHNGVELSETQMLAKEGRSDGICMQTAEYQEEGREDEKI